MKAGEISLQHSIPFNLEQIIPFIKEGTIEIAEGLFIVQTAYRKTNIELPIKMLDTVKQLAEQENITMSQWVEQAINQVLETITKEGGRKINTAVSEILPKK